MKYIFKHFPKSCLGTMHRLPGRKRYQHRPWMQLQMLLLGPYLSGNIATYDRGRPSHPVQALVITVITTGVIGEDFISGPFLSSLLCLATRRQVNRI